MCHSLQVLLLYECDLARCAFHSHSWITYPFAFRMGGLCGVPPPVAHQRGIQGGCRGSAEKCCNPSTCI